MWQGWNSNATDKLVQKVNQDIFEKCFTISNLLDEFPQILRTNLLKNCQSEIGLVQVLCTICTKMADVHKVPRMGSVLTFFPCYWEEVDKFLDRIITEDETFVQAVNAETKKKQSKNCMHKQAQKISDKWKQTSSWNLRKFIKKIWNHETFFIWLGQLLNKITGYNWALPLSQKISQLVRLYKVHVCSVATHAQLNQIDKWTVDWHLGKQHFTSCYSKFAVSLWQTVYFY